MAAPPVLRTASNTPLLTESINGSAILKPYRLPNGPCNFTNLTIGGASPPRCGCQRFWDQLEYTENTDGTPLDGATRDRGGFCMCSHHACYHDLLPPRGSMSQQVGTSGTLQVSSQHSRRKDSSFVGRFQSQNTDHHTSQPCQASISNETYSARVQDDKKMLSQMNRSLAESGLPDTGLRQSDSIAPGLPPIPSQCYLPSDISSGGVSGHSQSFQSFPRGNYKVLREKSSSQKTPRSNQANQYTTLPCPLLTSDQLLQSSYDEGESFIQSATEILTPSPRASPGPTLDYKIEHHVASVQAALDTVPLDGSLAKDFQSSGQIDGSNSFQKRPTGNADALISSGDGIVDLPRPVHESVPSGPDPCPLTAIAVRTAVDSTNSGMIDSNGKELLLPHQTLYHLKAILKLVSTHPALSTRVQNHEQRIDLLENVSCSYASAQEIHEGFELVDERIGEVESRVEELEKTQAALNDYSGVSSFRRRMTRLEDVDNSMTSQTSSELISAAIERTEFYSRLDNLESQLTDFRTLASPSFAQPWQVEVVLLPFGPSLKGIWSTVNQPYSQNPRNDSVVGDIRVHSQFGNLVAGRPTKSLEIGQCCWEDLRVRPDSNDAELLVARACGQGSKVAERLRSRGLVKTISVMGPGARDVQAALLAAFGDLPASLGVKSTDQEQRLPESMVCFYGLQASWIPLRKLHKDSRLRFLDPAEMITPALWTTSFLSSSVVMRATGANRLYITQSESYVQQEDATTAYWTWPKLRVLPRVSPDTESSVEVREADAREACWEWDERLDPPQSAHTSFTSQHSSLSIRVPSSPRSEISQSNQSSPLAESPVVSTIATSIPPQRYMSPLIEKSRPLHSRTTSMPLLGPLKISPPPSKRRITSFDHDPPRSTSPVSSPVRAPIELSVKRRRISRSPSRPRDTPRWSAGPPSPYYFEEPTEQKRGTTPFAYATPHSNAPYVDFRAHSATGMAMYDQDEHGSITEELGLDEEHDVDEFDSDRDLEPLPEDEDWKGIGDEVYDDASDQEQNALSSEEDEGMSDVRSQPSEHPSTRPSALHANTKGTFQIHVDEDKEFDTFDGLQTS